MAFNMACSRHLREEEKWMCFPRWWSFIVVDIMGSKEQSVSIN